MMTTPEREEKPLSLKYIEALANIYPARKPKRTAHGPSPHPYIIAADPRDKAAMEDAVSALRQMLEEATERVKEMAAREFAGHPDQTATARTALAMALENSSEQQQIDPSILAMRAAEEADRPGREPGGKRGNPSNANRTQLALVTAQRSLENLRSRIMVYLWNATTALERASAATNPLVPGDRTPRFTVSVMTTSINRMFQEEQDCLQRAWHRVESTG